MNQALVAFNASVGLGRVAARRGRRARAGAGRARRHDRRRPPSARAAVRRSAGLTVRAYRRPRLDLFCSATNRTIDCWRFQRLAGRISSPAHNCRERRTGVLNGRRWRLRSGAVAAPPCSPSSSSPLRPRRGCCSRRAPTPRPRRSPRRRAPTLAPSHGTVEQLQDTIADLAALGPGAHQRRRPARPAAQRRRPCSTRCGPNGSTAPRSSACTCPTPTGSTPRGSPTRSSPSSRLRPHPGRLLVRERGRRRRPVRIQLAGRRDHRRDRRAGRRPRCRRAPRCCANGCSGRVEDPRQLASLAGVPVLASRDATRRPGASAHRDAVRARTRWNSARCASGSSSRRATRRPRLVVAAPAQRDDAAAWTTMGLAGSLAQVEHRVLVVDADFAASAPHPGLQEQGAGAGRRAARQRRAA